MSCGKIRSVTKLPPLHLYRTRNSSSLNIRYQIQKCLPGLRLKVNRLCDENYRDNPNKCQHYLKSQVPVYHYHSQVTVTPVFTTVVYRSSLLRSFRSMYCAERTQKTRIPKIERQLRDCMTTRKVFK